MSSTAQSIGTITEKEYLEGEKLSEIKHEYVDGYVYAMAGASRRHSSITINIVATLRNAARKTSCMAYSSDVKVRAISARSYYYPDVVVGCDDDDADDYYLEKPCLIVEVLSKSTEQRDRREKLLDYTAIPTLKAYLLVGQDKPEVEVFYRKEEGGWRVESYEGLDSLLKIPCPDMELTLADVYEDINF